MSRRKTYENAHEIIPNIWLGNKEAANDHAFLKKNNIEVVFNCTKDLPHYHESNKKIKYIRLAVNDSLMNKDYMIMTDALIVLVPILENYVKNKKPVLIHCFAGMQRSACLLCAYLIKTMKMKLHEAIFFIQLKRNIAFTPQVNFIDSLLIYQNYLYKNKNKKK